MKISCYVVDDEELALATMVRLLGARVEIVGSAIDPVVAQQDIARLRPAALFLDIHMPEMDGFELLAGLPYTPYVIFTTAYDQHAVRAFEVNSLDYLLKPVSDERLLVALERLEQRMALPPEDLLARLAEVLHGRRYLRRVSVRKAEHLEFVETSEVTHFVARDRLAFACTERGEFLLTASLAELEARLDPAEFLRIHRSTIVNLRAVQQMSRWFAGNVLIRLNDSRKTDLTVSRNKVEKLRSALGV